MTKLAIKVINGIITFLLAFFYKIPINSGISLGIDFKIFTIDQVSYYFWGYVYQDEVFITLNLNSIETLIPITIWLILIISGIIPFFASMNEDSIVRSLKIYKVNILLIIFLVLIFGVIIIVSNLTDMVQILIITGLGYYLIIFLLVNNIILLKMSIPIKEH